MRLSSIIFASALIFTPISAYSQSYLDSYYAPPPQCDGPSRVPYTVQIVNGRCDGSPACSFPTAKPCRIYLESFSRPYHGPLLRHEIGHCNCPNWID